MHRRATSSVIPLLVRRGSIDPEKKLREPKRGNADAKTRGGPLSLEFHLIFHGTRSVAPYPRIIRVNHLCASMLPVVADYSRKEPRLRDRSIDRLSIFPTVLHRRMDGKVQKFRL